MKLYNVTDGEEFWSFHDAENEMGAISAFLKDNGSTQDAGLKALLVTEPMFSFEGIIYPLSALPDVTGVVEWAKHASLGDIRLFEEKEVERQA